MQIYRMATQETFGLELACSCLKTAEMFRDEGSIRSISRIGGLFTIELEARTDKNRRNSTIRSSERD